MVDRIREVIGYSQMSTTSFADTIGISRSGLTHLLTGRNQPSLDVARKILAKFPEISTEWLIMGMGEMIRPEEAGNQMEVESEETSTESAYQPENANLMRQVDLFGDYESLEDSEEAVVGNDSPADSIPEVSSVPASAPTPTPAPAQPQVSRVRTKPASAPNRREKGVGNVTTPERKLQKIVFFYDDHSFEVYNA